MGTVGPAIMKQGKLCRMEKQVPGTTMVVRPFFLVLIYLFIGLACDHPLAGKRIMWAEDEIKPKCSCSNSWRVNYKLLTFSLGKAIPIRS